MTESGPGTQGCTGHQGLSEEMRVITDLLAQRLAAWMQRPEQTGPASAPCSWCPICAVVMLARGQRPELAERLGLHAMGLLAVVREAMTPEGMDPAFTPAPHPPAAAPEPAAEHPDADRPPNGTDPPRVQRVTIRRPAAEPGAGC